MKITPRLPMHGRHADPSFVELRYFCFGANSKALASVFGVCEEFGESMRKRVLEVPSRSANLRMLEFALDMEVPDKTRLALWNHEPFISSVLESLRSAFNLRDVPFDYVAALLLQELSIRITRRGEQVDPNSPTLWWDEDERGVVLLYRKYAVDSFFVAKPCKHLHLKTDLLRVMREKMGQPAERNSMEKLRVECGKEDCRINITTHIIQMIESMTSPLESAEISQIYSALLDPYESLIRYRKKKKGWHDCYFCSTETGDLSCSKGCKLCITCCAVACLTRLQLCCPCCGGRLKGSDRGQILGLTAKWNQPALVTCEICKAEKPLREFPTTSTYDCVVCEGCVQRLSQTSSRCPVCTYSSHTFHVREEVKSSQLRDKEQRCVKCWEFLNMDKFKKFLKSSHQCMTCDDCCRLHNSCCCFCSCRYENGEEDRRAKALSPAAAIMPWCSQCREEKPLAQFSCALRLTHWWKCRVCNGCIQKTVSNACKHCKQPFYGTDATVLQEFQLNSQADVDIFHREASACVVCHEMLPAHKYSIHQNLRHPCNVCDDCYIIYDSISWQNKNCPKCQEAISSEAQQILHQQKRRIPAIEQKCSVCGFLESVKMKSKLKHECIVCDYCIRDNQDTTKCRRCKVPYGGGDLAFLRMIMPRNPNLQLASCAQCRNPVFPSDVECPNKCICAECIVKNYLKSDSTCSKCQRLCLGIDRPNVKCGNCLKRLRISKAEIRGICEKAHALCIYCINAGFESAKCKRCSARVQLSKRTTVMDVADARERFSLACYCGSNLGSTRALACSHLAHEGCISGVFQCRKCDYVLKENPEARTLHHFLAKQ